ncbi:MAG: type II toxin-antitoxin system VapB family antitoxin [Verrucomicrobiales bacterium]|nr:type II toxin-antitoxin system VapB family antitoxin [Verrucomicrobiales bacterium]
MAMKMTMHIDETALSEVIEMFGCESKTEAVNFALKEVVRRKKLRARLKSGMGLSSEELRNVVEPGYDPLALRVAEPPNDYGSGSAG